MKKFICLAVIAISLISCDGRNSQRPVLSVYNYSNAVVVDKLPQQRDVYLLRIRAKANGAYSIITLRVPKGEYTQFAIGDTIK